MGFIRASKKPGRIINARQAEVITKDFLVTEILIRIYKDTQTCIQYFDTATLCYMRPPMNPGWFRTVLFL